MRRGWWPVLATVIGVLACGGEQADAPASSDSASDPLSRARGVLARTPVFDGHNDLPWEIRAADEAPMDVAAYDLYGPVPGHTSIPLLQQGRVGAQFWSADRRLARKVQSQLDWVHLYA